MFNFFKKPKININSLGVIEDSRSPEEKNRDYKFEEIATAPPTFDWKEKPESEWVKYPIFFQDGSSSCVAQAVSKVLGIENYLEEKKFVHFSARDIYTRRSNAPGEGMFFTDGMNIGRQFGATIEQLMPSQGLAEPLMNMAEDRTPLTEIVAKVGKGGNNVLLPIDMDTIGHVIETQGKGVLLGVRFGPNEWDRPIPQIMGSDTRWGHAIVATNATLYQGKKALIIEDSWGTNSGIDGRRILKEEWFKNTFPFNNGRVTFAGYYDFLSNEGLLIKPSWAFMSDLKYGMTNNLDVKMLQECLVYLKFFPSNQECTGNFYGLTLSAVKLFQEKNGIVPATGVVGPVTRQKLNELFK
jgi:hypothetical protein